MKDTKITNCNIAAELMQPVFKDMDHEEVWVLFLKSGNKPICMEMLAKGSLDMVAIDSRTILRRALLNNAAGIVVFHNHPSDDPTPGREDIAFTAKPSARITRSPSRIRASSRQLWRLPRPLSLTRESPILR